MAILRSYMERDGRPVALYSDKHSIFRLTKAEPANGNTTTQFGRALADVGIEGIHAHSPQAKGRVERANQTLQDRLVKELRLRGLSDMDSANAYLPEFMADFNRRFAVLAANPDDAHRPLVHSTRELDLILAQQSVRTLSKSLSVQYANALYQIDHKGPGYTMRGARVIVCERPEGEVAILYKGRELSYTCYRRGEAMAPPGDGKAINQRVDRATEKQTATGSRKPSQSHPWRKAAIIRPMPAKAPVPMMTT